MADDSNDYQVPYKNDGADDQRQALANAGYTFTNGMDPDNPTCEVWIRYDSNNNPQYRDVCPPVQGGSDATDDAGGNDGSGFSADDLSGLLNNANTGGGGGQNTNPYGYGTTNFNPFNNPFGPQNMAGPAANVAPPTQPTPQQGFYNPVTSAVAALGGGTAAMPVFNSPQVPAASATPASAVTPQGYYNPVTNKGAALGGRFTPNQNFAAPQQAPGQNAGSSASRGNGDSSAASNACYNIVYYASGAGPQYDGRLVFYDKQSGEEVLWVEAISGCNSPVHYGTPMGTIFTVSGFSSPSVDNTLIFGPGQTISFKASLSPSSLSDPQTGNNAGPFYIFPMSDGSNCTKGALGVKGSYDQLKKVQDILKACSKCSAKLQIGGDPDNSDASLPPQAAANNGQQISPIPTLPLVPLPATPPGPQQMQPVPVPQQKPKNPVTSKSKVTDKSKVTWNPAAPKIDTRPPASVTSHPGAEPASKYLPPELLELIKLAQMIDKKGGLTQKNGIWVFGDGSPLDWPKLDAFGKLWGSFDFSKFMYWMGILNQGSSERPGPPKSVDEWVEKFHQWKEYQKDIKEANEQKKFMEEQEKERKKEEEKRRREEEERLRKALKAQEPWYPTHGIPVDQ